MRISLVLTFLHCQLVRVVEARALFLGLNTSKLCRRFHSLESLFMDRNQVILGAKFARLHSILVRIAFSRDPRTIDLFQRNAWK